MVKKEEPEGQETRKQDRAERPENEKQEVWKTKRQQQEKQNPQLEKTGLKNGMTEKEYAAYVKKVTPVNSTLLDVCRAFFTGGVICLTGQCISTWLTETMNLGKEDAGTWTSILLVALAVLLTGFNLYSKIVKWGGAGALVPITGFANSVASPAIESQVEGQVFGIGCSIFKIAGPVILYGVFTSWVMGLCYWLVINWNGVFLM